MEELLLRSPVFCATILPVDLVSKVWEGVDFTATFWQAGVSWGSDIEFSDRFDTDWDFTVEFKSFEVVFILDRDGDTTSAGSFFFKATSFVCTFVEISERFSRSAFFRRTATASSTTMSDLGTCFSLFGFRVYTEHNTSDPVPRGRVCLVSEGETHENRRTRTDNQLQHTLK